MASWWSKEPKVIINAFVNLLSNKYYDFDATTKENATIPVTY